MRGRHALDGSLDAHLGPHARVLHGSKYEDRIDPEIFRVTRNAACAP
jgi:hypothetical protein